MPDHRLVSAVLVAMWMGMGSRLMGRSCIRRSQFTGGLQRDRSFVPRCYGAVGKSLDFWLTAFGSVVEDVTIDIDDHVSCAVDVHAHRPSV